MFKRFCEFIFFAFVFALDFFISQYHGSAKSTIILNRTLTKQILKVCPLAGNPHHYSLDLKPLQ